jgi:hypothetical protein
VGSFGPNSFHPPPFPENVWNDMGVGGLFKLNVVSKGANMAYQKV